MKFFGLRGHYRTPCVVYVKKPESCFSAVLKRCGLLHHGLGLRVDVPVHRALRYQTDKPEQNQLVL